MVDTLFSPSVHPLTVYFTIGYGPEWTGGHSFCQMASARTREKKSRIRLFFLARAYESGIAKRESTCPPVLFFGAFNARALGEVDRGWTDLCPDSVHLGVFGFVRFRFRFFTHSHVGGLYGF